MDHRNETRKLLNKIKALENKNSDLEAVLEHKKKKSIERETELENELKEAWKSLEQKDEQLTKGIEDESVALQKTKTSDDDQLDSSKMDSCEGTVVVANETYTSHGKNLVKHQKEEILKADMPDKTIPEPAAKLTLIELKKAKHDLEICLITENDLRKKLLTEMRSMKPDFKQDCKSDNLIQLLDIFISIVMEKNNEISTLLHDSFQVKEIKFTETIHHLEENLKKLKQLTEYLKDENDTLNRYLRDKDDDILKLNEGFKNKEIELKNISEELSAVRQKLLKSDGNVASLQTEINLLRKSRTTEKRSDELMESLVIYKKQKYDLLDELQQTKEMLLKEQNKHVGEIFELNIALENKSEEYKELENLLYSLRGEYEAIQQSLNNNTQGSMVLESEIGEITKDLGETKAMACNLMGMLQLEEKNKQNERSALVKMSEEKVKLCQDLETKLYLFVAEHEEMTKANSQKVEMLEEQITIKDKALKDVTEILNGKVRECKEKGEIVKMKENAVKDLENSMKLLLQDKAEQSKILTQLQISVMHKDQELLSLPKLQNRVHSLEKIVDNLKDEEKLCKEYASRISTKRKKLEKEFSDQSKSETKLQSDVICTEEEMWSAQMINKEVSQLEKVKDLKLDKTFFKEISSSTLDLEEISEHSKTVAGLQKHIVGEEQDMWELQERVKRMDNVEDELKMNKHLLKKMKMKNARLSRTIEDFEQKEILNSSEIEHSLLRKVETLVGKLSDMEDDRNKLHKECDALNNQILLLKKDGTMQMLQLEELYKVELENSSKLKKQNEQLMKNFDYLRIEFDKCEQMVKDVRKEKRLQQIFQESDRKQMDSSAKQMDSVNGLLGMPYSDFRSIERRWNRMWTSSQKQQEAQNRNGDDQNVSG